MRQIQTSNMSFRVTKELKRRIIRFSEANDLHSSAVIREALSTYIGRNIENGVLRKTDHAERKA